jgi:hypothetical protein
MQELENNIVHKVVPPSCTNCARDIKSIENLQMHRFVKIETKRPITLLTKLYRLCTPLVAMLNYQQYRLNWLMCGRAAHKVYEYWGFTSNCTEDTALPRKRVKEDGTYRMSCTAHTARASCQIESWRRLLSIFSNEKSTPVTH